MRGLWLDGVPDPGTIEAEGYQAFGADLLHLTPAIVTDATERRLWVWSWWWIRPSLGGARAQAHAATDIALTIRQPTGSAIYFIVPPGFARRSASDEDYVEAVRQVCEARGYIARFWLERDRHIPRGSRAGLWNYAPAPAKTRREKRRARLGLHR